ncbi:hypothetical protein [Shewanella atlantica]|nr:hypothetical protein [Shewanella atlantica]
MNDLMCRYFSETPQALPCGLDDGIHAINVRCRILCGLPCVNNKQAILKK